MSPMPPAPSPPSTTASAWTNGTMVRVMMFQSRLIEKGMTGCTLRV
jgi:hypothetical protein